MTISDKKKRLIEQINKFIELHEQCKFDEIGSDTELSKFEQTYPGFDSDAAFNFHPLMIAWDFCHEWRHVCNHDFRLGPEGIEVDTWPILARHIVEKLTRDEEITDPLILRHFLDERKPPLISRIKNMLQYD